MLFATDLPPAWLFAVLALATVVLFVVACAVIAKLQIIAHERSDPYTEGDSRYWNLQPVEATFHDRTLSGFRCSYKLKTFVRRVNNEHFRMHRMLGDGKAYLPVHAFNCHHVQSRLLGKGPHYLRYMWFGGDSPGLAACNFKYEGNKVIEEFDPNAYGLIAEINRAAREEQWECYGCSVEIMVMERPINEEIIDINFGMLTAEDHVSAEQDIKYLRFQEASVIKALKLRRDLEQPTKEHKGDHVTIKHSVVGQRVVLSWTLSDAAKSRGARVWGFRREDCYWTKDPYDESGVNGLPIVDSASDDSRTDHAPAGRTCFYTFFLYAKNRDGTEVKYSLVRFDAHIPEQSDIDRLSRLLDQSRAGSVVDVAEKEKRASTLRKINFRVETRAVLLEHRKKKIAEVNADARYTTDDKTELIQAIEDEIRDEIALM